jgi:hypothetical protein
LYNEAGYQGEAVRLAPGEYDESELKNLGFTDEISSLMVPWGFKVIAYSESGLTGSSKLYTQSIGNLDKDNIISSLKVIDMKTYD